MSHDKQTLMVPPPAYESLLIELQAALGPDRKPLLIGIDGREGTGKTSLSNWLAWQLGMPAINLDLFLIQGDELAPITRRVADLDRCIKSRGNRPFVVEGVLLLDALDEVGRVPDFLVFVEDQPSKRTRPPDSDLVDTREFSLTNQVLAYLSRRSPADRANFKLKGFWSGGDDTVKKPLDPERQQLEQAVGHFILDLGMIEATMIQALAILTAVPPTQAHYLLSRTAGGAMADLLKDAATAKGIDIKAMGLRDAFGTIQNIMNYRNRLVHDAIAFHSETQSWVRGKGMPIGDKTFGEKTKIDPAELDEMSKKAWAAMKVIGVEILQKHGGFIYKP